MKPINKFAWIMFSVFLAELLLWATIVPSGVMLWVIVVTAVVGVTIYAALDHLRVSEARRHNQVAERLTRYVSVRRQQ